MIDFDNWFKKKFRDLHDAILCGDLIAGNYKKVSKKSYEAGQQSKQKEIDRLKAIFAEALDVYDRPMCDETALYQRDDDIYHILTEDKFI